MDMAQQLADLQSRVSVMESRVDRHSEIAKAQASDLRTMREDLSAARVTIGKIETTLAEQKWWIMAAIAATAALAKLL